MQSSLSTQMLLFGAAEAFYNHREKRGTKKQIFILSLSLFQKYNQITFIKNFLRDQVKQSKAN